MLSTLKAAKLSQATQQGPNLRRDPVLGQAAWEAWLWNMEHPRVRWLQTGWLGRLGNIKVSPPVTDNIVHVLGDEAQLLSS